MTIQGALADLNNLLNADDVPFYYEGSIKKVIETIEMEFEDKELEQKDAVLKALEDVRAEIEAMYGVTDFCDGSIRVDKYEVLASIEQKIAEVKGDKE